MARKADIQHKEFRTEIVIYPNTPKGAAWVAKHITTNVTDLHYPDKERALEVLGDMARDGLTVEEMAVYEWKQG